MLNQYLVQSHHITMYCIRINFKGRYVHTWYETLPTMYVHTYVANLCNNYVLRYYIASDSQIALLSTT